MHPAVTFCLAGQFT